MKRLPRISDVIAQDDWFCKRDDGSIYRTRIIIGRPRPENRRSKTSDWFCPVFIEGITTKVCKAMGVGPVDSLMNALILVKSRFDATKHLLVDLGPKRK
jgi:hypothetical protein